MPTRHRSRSAHALSWASPSDAGQPDSLAGNGSPLPLTIHATTVALGDRGLLILGPSGSGKSGLALQLMAFGASLVADDRTILRLSGDSLLATCPSATRGLIEARGLGLLSVPSRDCVTLSAAVDLGQTETQRLPPPAEIMLLGRPLPLLRGTANSHFPAAVFHYMTARPAER
jgi:HPr kinase/phosphorylase